MTILFFSRLFYPHIGGVEKHVLEISRPLVKKRYSVTVLTEKFERNLLNTDEIDGIKILRIDSGRENWFKKFRVWKNLWRYRKLIKKSDIIHIHDVFFWYLPFKFLYPLRKVFTTFHGYEGDAIPGIKARLMHKIAEVLSGGNICVGDFLKKWYGTKPNYVTYGAVEILPINTNTTNKYQLANKRFKIVFLGRLEEETGIMEYLKALLMLKNKGVMFDLTVLGDGKLRKNAEKFSKNNKINAEFKGFVGNTDKYFRGCDFVFVSRYLGILEALAYKKFVFAHHNNLIKKDYLEMTPFAKFISISSDYKQLTLSIEYFLKNEAEKENMINNGYDWVKEKTWDNLVNMHISLWNKSHSLNLS